MACACKKGKTTSMARTIVKKPSNTVSHNGSRRVIRRELR